jgi:ubiquinone/menaquinone biosynthesis C-methylase UbiE
LRRHWKRGSSPQEAVENEPAAHILLPVKKDNANVNPWSQSAPYWEKHRENIRRMFSPITAALITDAHITPGHTVLDVATGPGEPALSIAELVGPKGEVWGIDPVPEMVAGALRAAAIYGFRNVHFEVAFADHLSFNSGTFDSVVCRFGVMFFPSPLDGLREMLRVLKPDGKLAVAVWHFAEHNPFHYVLSRVVAEEFGFRSGAAVYELPNVLERWNEQGSELRARNISAPLASLRTKHASSRRFAAVSCQIVGTIPCTAGGSFSIAVCTS